MVERILVVLLIGLSACLAAPAKAQSTVECHSIHYEYSECWAGPLRTPQLVHQISSSACIVNRSWGYNRRSGYIWVAQGCSGVFADVGGYHHGRGDSWDTGARHYNERGHDSGAVVAGVVLGAIIAGAAQDRDRRHTTSNVDYSRKDRYSGCHGTGCLVDNPDRGGDQDIDPRPAFDRQGNPNFDTHGNWQGCHGAGCLVDDPDSGG